MEAVRSGSPLFAQTCIPNTLIVFAIQCKLSTTATHGLQKSGCFTEVTAIERSKGVGEVSKWAYFCIQPGSSFIVRCIVQYVYFIELYRTLCRKPYFLRYRQLEVGRVTMYYKGYRHKYCFR